jgi:hypothetical protein
VSAGATNLRRTRLWLQLCSRWIVGAGVVALAGWLAPACAQTASAATERAVKAAYVYKFLDYVDWPAGVFATPDAPIVVGVIGSDDLAAELADTVKGRTVQERAIEVRRMRPAESLAGVHVLFIGAAERSRTIQLARAAHARGILTITASDDGLERGSIINLVVVGGRVRFEVALARNVRMPGQ